MINQLQKYILQYFGKKLFFPKYSFLFLIIFFLSSFNHLWAQDSILIGTHSSNQLIKDQVFNNPAAAMQWNVKNFTQSKVYFNYKKNEFSRKQTAKETQKYGFITDGFYSFSNDLKVFGNLLIEKSEETKVPYVLSEQRTEEEEVISSPHYFVVPRAGDWTNQKYYLKGGVSKSFFNHLILTAKFDFTAEKYSRKIDPRPEVTKNFLKGEMQLGYTINSHLLYASGGYSQLKKDYNIIYSNNDLNYEAYPETYLRFHAGYGRIINAMFSKYGTTGSSRMYFYRTQTPFFGGGYSYAKNNTLFNASYNYSQSMETFYLFKFADEDYKRFKYRVKTHKAELYFRKKNNNNIYQSYLDYQKDNGLNYDVYSQGSNYKNSLQKISFQFSILNEENDFKNYNFGIVGNYALNKYQDVLTSIFTKINSLNAGIFINKDFKAWAEDKFNAGININAYFSISTQFQYNNVTGTNPNTFIKEVLFHDYAFNTTNRLEPGFDLQYFKKLKNSKKLVFYCNTMVIFALQDSSKYYANMNTKSSFAVNAGIQLNY